MDAVGESLKNLEEHKCGDSEEDRRKWLDSDRLQEQLCHGSISTVNMHAGIRSLNHHERSP